MPDDARDYLAAALEYGVTPLVPRWEAVERPRVVFDNSAFFAAPPSSATDYTAEVTP